MEDVAVPTAATIADPVPTEVVKEKKDDVLDPLLRLDPSVKSSMGSNGDPPKLSSISGALGSAMQEQTASPLDKAMDLLRPRIKKVADPIAFLTSAEKNAKNKTVDGSYDKAIADPAAEGGFFEQAKGECAALGAELGALMAGQVNKAELPGVRNLVALLGAYGALYTAIQGSKGISAYSTKKAEALTVAVQDKLKATRDAFGQVPSELLGDASGAIRGALDDIDLFLASWQTVAKTSGETSASNQMGALFLQTTERQRQILNNYGQLDERGGSNLGTAKMAVRGKKGETVKDPKQAEAQINEQGGLMAVAMKTYGLEPEQAMLRDRQMQLVLQRLKAGEFTTEEEFIKAFQQGVGGGATSKQYMADLKTEAQGFWQAHQAKQSANAEKTAYGDAKKHQSSAESRVPSIDKAITYRDQNAKSKEQNVGNYDDLSPEEIEKLEKEGKLSKQEQARLNMDQKAADEALASASRFQQLAQRELAAAKADLQASDDKITEGVGHHNQALQYIAQAKLLQARVKFKTDPALARGLQQLDADILTVEASLKENEQIRKQLVANRLRLESIIDARSQKVEGYDPAKLEVPLPTAVFDGKKLENEAYSKVSVDLTGPAFGVFWWLGGVEGSLSNVTSIDKNGAENWTKARIQAYVGLKANLWLIEAGVKISGFFEAQKKSPATLLETLEAGTEELGRWAYAWWYDLGSVSEDLSKILEAARVLGDRSYERLQSKAAGGDISALTGAVDKETAAMEQLHAGLTQSLVKAYSKNDTQVSEDEIQKIAGQAVPIASVKDSFANLKKATDSTEALQRLTKDRATFSDKVAKTRAEAVSDVKAVDPGQNNPDVKFEAGVGIEGFVGAKLGKTAEVGFSAAKVWSISDGDGESFDKTVKDKMVLKATGAFELKGGRKVEVEVSAENDSDGPDGPTWKIGVEGNIPLKKGFGKEDMEGTQVMESLRQTFDGQKHIASVEDWVKAMPEKMQKALKEDGGSAEPYKIESSQTSFIKLGGSITLGKDKNGWSVKKWDVKFGIARRLQTENKFGKVAFETGNVLTLSSEEADDKAGNAAAAGAGAVTGAGQNGKR